MRIRDYLPLLYIWGGFDAVRAAAEIFWNWSYPDWLGRLLFVLALLLSGAAVVRTSRTAAAGPSTPSTHKPLTGRTWGAIGGSALFAGLLWLLLHTFASDPAWAAAARSILLSAIYLVAGILLDRRLLYLSAWLLVLCALICFFYLGFAPVVLGLFGGLSMIAGGLILRKGRIRSGG